MMPMHAMYDVLSDLFLRHSCRLCALTDVNHAGVGWSVDAMRAAVKRAPVPRGKKWWDFSLSILSHREGKTLNPELGLSGSGRHRGVALSIFEFDFRTETSCFL